MPLHFYEKAMLVLVFAYQKKSEEDFLLLQKKKVKDENSIQYLLYSRHYRGTKDPEQREWNLQTRVLE